MSLSPDPEFCKNSGFGFGIKENRFLLRRQTCDPFSQKPEFRLPKFDVIEIFP